MSKAQTADERAALQTVINVLHELDEDARQKILRTAETFYGLSHSGASSNGGAPASAVSREPQFGSRPTVTPKEFMLQKQPDTDVERVACLAYYLTHYRDTPHFRTIDISKLNTEAAQVKFSNTAYSVANATNTGYLVPAGKGSKQLSAAGELYVQALPDKESARTAMAAALKRRRRKRGERQQQSNNKS